jgi:tetratricopeptide (TPR) repeat protein
VGWGITLGSLGCALLLAGPADAQEEMGVPLGESPALVEPAVAPAPPPPPEQALLRAWTDPAGSLDERVARTRRAALESGTWSFDPAARAVLSGVAGGDPLARAEAAVALAPHLPLAHMELASAHWLHAEDAMAALRAMPGLLRAIASHPEASLWFAGTGLFVLAIGLGAGTLLLLVLVSLRASPNAAHDLGHLVPGDPPGFARAALLGALLLVPIAAGEGVFGVSLVLLAIGVAYGTAWQRVVLAVAALALWGGLHPLARVSSAALEEFPNDTIARAAYSLSQGLATRADLMRLESVPDDPLALRALAIDARRRGHLGRADALYQQILAQGKPDAAVLNNAANVRLALGHQESAVELYGRALDFGESPVVYFNLSQAYGRAFNVDALNRVLSDAQRVDGDLVAQLTALQRVRNESFVVDLPLDLSLLWQRVLAPGAGSALAKALRTPVTPGRVGGQEPAAGIALAAAFGVGLGIGALRRSSGCSRCGARMCARCETDWAGSLCQSCDLLFNHPDRTDRALRLQRLEALRRRDRRVGRATALAAVCVPGAASLLANHPLRAFAAVVGLMVAAACFWWRAGLVPDPLIAGRATPTLFAAVGGLALLVYAASLLSALAARRGGDT